MANGSDSGGIGLLGVLIGAVIVVALGYFLLAGNMGGGAGPSTSVNVEAPRAPGK